MTWAFWFTGHAHPPTEFGFVSADSAEEALRLLVARDEEESAAQDRLGRREPRLDVSQLEARPWQCDERSLAIARDLHGASVSVHAATLAEERRTGCSLRGDGGGWWED